MDYGQDQQPGMGTFATQARFNTQAPMPPARNTLQDLMDYVSGAQAGYEKNGPVADITRSAMPGLGALLGLTIPSAGKRMPTPAPTGPQASAQLADLLNQHIAKVQALARKGINP